ncbi:MAG: hypothetical protein HKL96_11065 [Phycisphaerales bacterium]|nr:hypothetical protein [Phycisphaerales bacterium]
MMTKRLVAGLLCALAFMLCLSHSAVARRGVRRGRHPQPRLAALTPHGQQLMAQYANELHGLQQRIKNALPSIDPAMEARFMAAYRAETACRPYLLTKKFKMRKGESRAMAARARQGANGTMSYPQALARCQAAAFPILRQVNSFLSSDNLDATLVKASIIGYATPRGLAAFAQQSPEHEQLINELLNDPTLMRQMQMADGARHGNYGLTMEIYTAIEKASAEAHKGILQRLALGTALMQAPGKPTVGPASASLGNAPTPFDPVKRFLNYQKAYLDKDLSPYFPTLTAWDCRFVTNDSFTDKEISWYRTMLQNYEPQDIFSEQYLNPVHTDVGYCHPNWDAVSGLFAARVLAGGGECGPRAWMGRLGERAFGIPVWGYQQRGHAAMSHWTPNGWVSVLGAGWQWAWWYNRSGLNFYLETQARQYPQQFIKALRAQWVAAALGEQRPDLRTPGTGDLWYALAIKIERAIVASGAPAPKAPSYAQLAQMYGPTKAQMVEAAPVSRSEMEVTTDGQGVIHIPAVACQKSLPRGFRAISFTKSFLGGMQAHYIAWGKGRGRHHQVSTSPISYTVFTNRAGRYQLTATIVTVKAPQTLLVDVNHAGTSSEMTIPWTDGIWQQTQPVAVTLKSGNNVLTFKQGTGFKAMTIKEFVLTPVQ